MPLEKGSDPARLLCVSHIRRMCNARGKRCGKEFLQTLGQFVAEKVDAACDVHNGGKLTLDASVAYYAGVRPRGFAQ